MTDPQNLNARLLMACSRRKDRINARDRAILNAEIADRNVITAEAKVAESDAEMTQLLDLKLAERQADKLVNS
jgi:hypothetical protein